MRKRAGLGVRALAVILGVFCGIPSCAAGGEPPPTLNVLVLYSAHPNETNDAGFLDSIETGVRARVRGPITFYQSYLTNRDDKSWEASYLESQAETFRRTYARTKLDLVITVSPQAADFALEYRNKMFPKVPIVFTQVGADKFEGQRFPGVTGVTIPLGVRETINLAMRLHPDTETVAIISGPDWDTLSVEHDELLRYGVKVADLIGPAGPDVLQQVSTLPPHTVVLFQLAPNLDRPEYKSEALLDLVARRFPTYSAWENDCLNHGCIGGAFGDHSKQYASVVEVVTRVLGGERPEDVPVVHDANFRFTADWRELQRWHISESALPAGSRVLYREPTFLERYEKYMVLATLLVALQALLVVGFLIQRARKRKAEAVLRESEKRFKVMADTTPALIWMCDAEGRVTYLNEQWLSFTGADPYATNRDAWSSHVHQDDLQGVMDILSRALKSQQPFSKEYRVRRADGVYRWMFDVASPRVNGDGSFAGFIGSAVDVSDRRMAQEALEKVSGQLIDAQERERSRLARELHDDICQRLAMLSLKIEKVSKSWGQGQSTVADQMEQIWKQCSELTGDVQALSHELHPSILDNLGLATAVRSYCREISEQNGVIVEFCSGDLPRRVPREVALSLFRVVQEALRNAVKHSGQKHFAVCLHEIGGQLELEVIDQGSGFDAAKSRTGRGLGLVSMAERIYHVNGTFHIESRPNTGTRVHARVPIAAESNARVDALN